MLGKGLESLIPPQDDGGQAPQSAHDDSVEQDINQPEAPRPAPAPTPDPEPQILSFDFNDPYELEAPQSETEPLEETAVSAETAPETTSPAGGTTASKPAYVPLSETSVDKPSFAPPSPKATEGHGKATADKQDHIYHVEIEKVEPNPSQPRRVFNETGLWELAKSIREFGFLQPLVVSRVEKETENGVDVGYQIIAGERRLLAAKMLGLEYVPAIIRDVDLEREKLELAVIENIQRENLSPIEIARAFQRMQEEFRLTQREIAAKLGKSRETVANTVRLLDLPLYIQDAIEKGQITESHGRLLLSIPDPSAQKKLFEDIVANSLTTREVKHRVQASRPERRRADHVSPELKMLEEKLSMELGTPVSIHKGEKSGKITISFYSEEELEGIVSKIGGEE